MQQPIKQEYRYHKNERGFWEIHSKPKGFDVPWIYESVHHYRRSAVKEIKRLITKDAYVPKYHYVQ